MGALCQKGPMHTVFISYSSEDKGIAFGVCRALEAGGLTCWLAPRDVMAGRPDSGQISEAIRRARVFVLVLSRNSDQSRQVLREVERAAHSRLHKLDRLARSITDLMAILQALGRKGVAVRILNLGMDTQTPTGKLMLTVLGGVAQFEREMMLERQR